jgi:hypothetical protein
MALDGEKYTSSVGFMLSAMSFHSERLNGYERRICLDLKISERFG